MTITQALNAIKTAVYGKDVRNAIYEAISLCYNDRPAGGINATNTLNTFYSGITLITSTLTNAPFSGSYMLLAAGDSTNCCQIAYSMTNTYVPVTRRKSGSTWTSWVNLRSS